MRLVGPEGYLDFDLDLFWDVAEPINDKIQTLLAFDDPEVADMLDYGATIEQLLGVALAAAQVYIVAVSNYHRTAKEQTLDLGPTHASGHAIARLINHGANFWKHADEWNWDALTDRAKRIIGVFRDLDAIEPPSFDLSLLRFVSNVTASSSPDLEGLRRLLEQWRTSVEQAFPVEPHGAT
jgi:hypothetical protein